MPYRIKKSKKYRNVTYSRDVINEGLLGFTEIAIHRPKFFFFEFQGLRANIPHWIFFGNQQVTKYCNTSFSLTDYTTAARTSKIKEPGDSYVTETAFPTGQGGPTNGGGDTALISNSDGSLSGLFYLQSNATTNFSILEDGINFSALDVSVMDRDEALSYAASKFYGKGQYEDWYKFTTTETEVRREKYYHSELEYYDNDDRDPDPGVTTPTVSSCITPTTTTTFSTPTFGDYSGGGSGSYGISVGVSSTYTGTGSGGYGTAAAGSGCFVADTPIDMADGTQKAIIDLRLGELTKGGVVQGIHVYDGAPLYEYDGVRVSGTHYVIENDRAVMVKNTSKAIKVPDVYGLYTIDTSDRRIYSNGIEFADHNGDGIIIDFFNNMNKDVPKVEIENQISAAML